MQGIGGCYCWQGHIVEQGSRERFRISRDLQKRHVGQYAKTLRRGGCISSGALADDESRDLDGEPMAMLVPPFVRGLLVGGDPQNPAWLHREIADDRGFEVNGWIH
jgi:hypothetical protein